MKSQEAKQLLSLDWDFATGQYVFSIQGTMPRKAGFAFDLNFSISACVGPGTSGFRV